jgi:SAM-dependent methyltransferase
MTARSLFDARRGRMESAEYDLMDAAEDAMWWYRALHLRLLRALDGVGGRVLDAGCGTGGLLARLTAERPDLAGIGVDFSPVAAARAAAKSGAPTACASVTALPFAAGAFDAVVSADVLCHRSVDPQAALREMARVLRPGGRLVLNLPAYQWLMSAHDAHVHTARRSTARGLRALLEDCGYTGVRTSYWNGLLLPLVIVERKLLARGPGAASDVKAFHPWADAAFFAVTEAERRLPASMPAGSSVLAIATTP